MKKRVMVKISGESLKGDSQFGFCDKTIFNLINQIDKIKEKYEICILVGGGNFLRGKDLNSIDKYKADKIGMLSTVINGIYLSEQFKNRNIKNDIYGAFPVVDLVYQFNKDEIVEKLQSGKIILLTGGTGHPYFTTDTGVVLRAIELNCKEVLLAKSVDAVYDSDPKINKNAIRYSKITYDEIVDKHLQVVDTTSMTLAKENKLIIKIFSSAEKNGILKTLSGKNIGTIIKN